MLRGIKPSAIKKNLNNIIEILQDKNINILLAGMLAQETLGKEYKSKFDMIYPELAKKFKISLPFLLDGVALDPKVEFRRWKTPQFKRCQSYKQKP